jgi:hypothetical protein
VSGADYRMLAVAMARSEAMAVRPAAPPPQREPDTTDAALGLAYEFLPPAVRRLVWVVFAVVVAFLFAEFLFGILMACGVV